MTDGGRERVRFSGFELDLRSGELWDPAGRRVRLPRQPLRTLIALVRAQGDVVLREELRRELWPGNTFVDYEHGINAAIRRLRDTIGDSATAPRFIETLPGVGYRFIAPVTFVEPGTSLSATTAAGSTTMSDLVGIWPRPVWSSGTRRTIALGVIAIAAVTLPFLAHRLSGRLPRQLVRLTSTSGLNIDPALSPDGAQVAYASDRAGTGNLDIWLQPVNGGPARRLTTDAGDEVEPSFSPDGQSVFYSRRETGGVYQVATKGGESRLIVAAQRSRTPRVSADGQWLLYWSGQPVWSDGSHTRRAPGATSTLAVVPVKGGTPNPLAPNLPSARYGVWSPDGRRILFLGESQAGDLDWFVIPREGGAPRRTGAIRALRSAGIKGVPIPGGWTKTQHVIFTTAGSEVSNVWQVPISPESAEVSGDAARLTFGSAEERSPSVSDSNGAVFTSIIENVDVWRLRLDPQTGVGVGPMERVTDDAAIDQMMNVARHGSSMVFVSTRTKSPEVWLRDLPTGRERQLTFDGADFARLNPDGSSVAIHRLPPVNAAEIRAIPDGATRRVCQNCQVVDWSADGAKVVVQRGNPAALFVVDLATGSERPLASHPVWNLFRARFSPDGRWVAFHTTNSTELRQIYVIPANGTAAVPFSRWIPVVEDFGIQPAWAADSRAVYYFSLRDGSFCAWMQPVDVETRRPSGDPRVVWHLHDPRLRAVARALVNNDVHGNFLYVTLTETKGNVWMLTE
jgi:Tol biopolymer transport system component/DNA-binding winged helix-turn-helix (wHTH) protein